MEINILKYFSLAQDKGTLNRTFSEHLKEYIWMLWDGLTFFGFDDTKLARLNGVPTSYLDKFKNKKWLSTSILGVTIVTYVILSSASKLGTVKFQKIDLTE